MTAAHRPPLVSVVTPVYNGETYLAECIESVLEQTYENWEYVIVDNRSTDATPVIAARYAELDPRIRVHTNRQFLSIFENWNESLRQISSKSAYCKIVHADDLLLPECLTKMVEVAEAQPSAGIVGAYSLYGDRIKLGGMAFPRSLVSGRDICRRMLLDETNLFGSPTALLIRCEIIRGADCFYDESKIQADMAVCLEVLQKWDYAFVHQILTFTRVHEESITARRSRPLHVDKLARLELLKGYGRAFLSDDEYRTAHCRQLTRYYRFLGRCVRLNPDRGFWAYHRDQLERLGEPLEPWRVAVAWLRHFARRVLDPISWFKSAIFTTASSR